MKKISIMIVDDHCLVREAFGHLLSQRDNFDVLAMTGGNENVIKLVRENRPDILLLDINMAPLSGFDLIKIVLKNSPLTKVIGLSMHTQLSYVKKMLRLGAKGYLTKGSTGNEMIEAITQVNAGHTYICNEVKNILSEQILNEKADTIDVNMLSERELQVIGLLNDGQSSRQIAGELKISSKTVEVHRHNILKKFKLKSTVSVISHLHTLAFDF